MEKKYIFFDLDGTLTDSQKGITGCVKKALDAVGIEEENYAHLLRFIGPPLKNSFTEYYHLSEEETAKAIRVYHDYYDNEGLFDNEPYPQIRQMLAELTEDGRKLYVATSKPEWMANKILEHFDLASFFTLIGGVHEGLVTKADVIRDVMKREGLEEHLAEILMVGDRHHDVDGAKEAGIDCLGVSWGFAIPGELEEAGAVHVTASPAETAAWILKREA